MKPLYMVVPFFVFAISGCYTPHFLPNTAPVPMFEKAGNVLLAGYAGTNSYDVHAAVSPIEHIGIVGATSMSFSKKVDDSENNKKPDNEAKFTHGHRYYEGALVYYFSPIEMRSEVLKLEILAGYGAGTANGSIDSGRRDILGFPIQSTNRVEADYLQYYLQLNAGMNKVEFKEIDLHYGSIFRLSKTKYSNFKKDSQPIKINPMEGTYIQIGAFGSIGTTSTGVIMQAGWLYPISDDKNRPSYSPLFISAGLRIGLF